MRVLRVLVVILFVIVSCLFGVVYVTDRMTTDYTYPEITIEQSEQILDVPLTVTKEDLLVGVTAQDGKDGDLTSQVILESISQFSEPGVSTVTYSVCDSDNHVVKKSRQIRYVGYQKPIIEITKPLIFSKFSKSEVLKAITVTDSIDGDISANLTLENVVADASNNGCYYISLKVVNSKGDTVYLDLPVLIESAEYLAPTITLNSYLVRVKQGETLDPNQFVESLNTEVEGETPKLTVNSKLNTREPGEYFIHYYATDSENRVGHTVLTVIVEAQE